MSLSTISLFMKEAIREEQTGKGSKYSFVLWARSTSGAGTNLRRLKHSKIKWSVLGSLRAQVPYSPLISANNLPISLLKEDFDMVEKNLKKLQAKKRRVTNGFNTGTRDMKLKTAYRRNKRWSADSQDAGHLTFGIAFISMKNYVHCNPKDG